MTFCYTNRVEFLQRESQILRQSISFVRTKSKPIKSSKGLSPNESSAAFEIDDVLV